MSNEVAVRQNEKALAITPGTEDLVREDLVIPRVRLVQPTSALDGNAGELYNSLTGESQAEIRAIILRIGKSRVMWPEGFERNQSPLCASNDGIAPRPEFAGEYAERCEGCPMTEWGDDGTPPRCAFGYTYLCSDVGCDDLPFVLTASRSNLKAARTLNTLSKAFGPRRQVVISAQQAISDRGKYFTLRFALGDNVAPEDVGRYVAMSRALGGVTLGPDVGNGDSDSEAEDAEPLFG